MERPHKNNPFNNNNPNTKSFVKYTYNVGVFENLTTLILKAL
jgi:hypothetical protein